MIDRDRDRGCDKQEIHTRRKQTKDPKIRVFERKIEKKYWREQNCMRVIERDRTIEKTRV